MSCAPEGWKREGEGLRNGERKEQTEEEERDAWREMDREGGGEEKKEGEKVVGLGWRGS